MSEIAFPQDTIFALSSGRLPSGVAVVRISGPRVRFVLETIIGVLPAPRHAAYKLFRARNGDPIDHGLVLFFLVRTALPVRTAPNFMRMAARPSSKGSWRSLEKSPDAG